MLNFKANHAQRAALEGLAYWVADSRYIRERYGDEEPELLRCADTLSKCIFPELDRMGVPFWVQNAVICFSEDWRRFKSCYLWDAMREKNILM